MTDCTDPTSGSRTISDPDLITEESLTAATNAEARLHEVLARLVAARTLEYAPP